MTRWLSQYGPGYLAGLISFAGCGSETASHAASTLIEDPIREEEVTAFIEAYDTAWLNKDTLQLKEYLDSSYVYFNSRGAIRHRQYVLDLVGHPTYRVEGMSRTEIMPQIHGAIAIVATRWTATPYYQGVRYDDDQRCVLTLSKQSGFLRMLSDHCTEILE